MKRHASQSLWSTLTLAAALGCSRSGGEGVARGDTDAGPTNSPDTGEWDGSSSNEHEAGAVEPSASNPTEPTSTSEPQAPEPDATDDAELDDPRPTDATDATDAEPTPPPLDDLCTIKGQRVLRLPATFRDFSEAHPDFGEPCPANSATSGLVQDRLGPDGRPVAISTALFSGCITSTETFAQWYVDDAENVLVSGEVVLFDDGAGGFVNRFGPNGEQHVATESGTELGAPSTDPTCADSCQSYASYDTPCTEECAELRTEALAAEDDYAEASETGDAGVTDLDALRTRAATTRDAADACDARCAPDISASEDACRETCKPCSYDPRRFCTFGKTVSYDGTPLFFPVDEISGPTRDPGEAKLPEQFGHPSYPWERDVFGEAVEHNFYFTTEIRIPFSYTSTLNATVEFLGDDDAWVFINGKLAIDLGGIHVPAFGSASIDATTAESYELVPGGSYEISVFHAERQMEGSAFRLALRGFEALGSGSCPN